MYIAWNFKAFALTGRQACGHDNPGCYPGLGASALSGRVAIYLFFQGKLRLCLIHVLRQHEVQDNSEQEDYGYTVVGEYGAYNLWEDVEHARG